MKKIFPLLFIVQVSFHFLIPYHAIAQQTDFLPVNTLSKKKFFINIIAQRQQTSGGEYKVPIPPFSYNPAPVSMSKAKTAHYQFGGTFGYTINKNLGITLGITHSTLGQNYADYSGTEQDSSTSNTSVLYTYSKKVKLSYLNFPLQLHYNTSEDKSFSFTCYIGIYYARLLKYTDAWHFKGSNSYGSISQADTASGNTFHDIYNVSFPWAYGQSNYKYSLSGKPFKSYDIGEEIGIGLQKKLSDEGFLFIMLNYQSGFIDIKNPGSQFTVNNKIRKYYNFFGTLDPNQFLSYKNSLVGISIGLKIKI